MGRENDSQEQFQSNRSSNNLPHPAKCNVGHLCHLKSENYNWLSICSALETEKSPGASTLSCFTTPSSTSME